MRFESESQRMVNVQAGSRPPAAAHAIMRSMFKPFEHPGFWWDANEPGTRWPGTLSFDPVNGAVLRRTVAPDIGRLFGPSASFDLIHGEAANGLAITLVNCFERNHTDIFVNEVITGFHADSADPLIASAAVVIENMGEWWGPGGIAHQPTDRRFDLGVRYERPDAVTVHDDAIIRTTICSDARSSFERRRVSIEEEIRIEMVAKPLQPLSAFRRRAHVCQDLIAVAALTLSNLDDFRIAPPSPNGTSKVFGHVYGVPIFKNPAEGWPHFLFRSTDVSERLPDMFSAWFASAESLSVVRSLYMSGAYGKGFIELRFLALAQAAEACHRRFYEGRDFYMDAAAYRDGILPKLQSAIPDSLDSSHKEALRSRLRFGNEFSLNKRLTMLFADHAEALAVVVPSPESWIKPIRDFRNGFTHHPVADDGAEKDKDKILKCIYVLRILIELCFLKAMGLDADTRRQLAGRCDHYRQIRERFFGGS